MLTTFPSCVIQSQAYKDNETDCIKLSYSAYRIYVTITTSIYITCTAALNAALDHNEH